MKRIADDMIARMRDMRKQGMSNTRIGIELDISESTVRKYIGAQPKEISKQSKEHANRAVERVNPKPARKSALYTHQSAESIKKNERCRTCEYCWETSLARGYGDAICDYLGITGHPRPCKPGLECTAYKERTKKRRKKNEIDGVTGDFGKPYQAGS